MGKRKHKSRDIDRRLERIEKMLLRRGRRHISSTCDEESSSDNRSRSRSPHARSRTKGVTRRKRRCLLSYSLSPSPTDSSESNVVIEEIGGRHIVEPVPPEATAVTEEAAAPPLPADLEGLLGLEGTPKISNAIELHESIRQRWMAILQNGLTEEIMSNLIRKYDPPKNCDLLIPPKLNEEVAAAMQESGIKLDKRIADQQTVLAAAISAVGKVLNSMISSSQNSAEIETLSDSARLLCGLYHSNTETRRSLILPGLNKDIKEALTQSPISEYLFGDKLQDKVNACKALKKSTEDLKNTPAQKPPVKKTLNYRGPQRSQLPRPSGQKPKLRQQTYRSTKPAAGRSKHSPQRQRHPRRQVHRRH